MKSFSETIRSQIVQGRAVAADLAKLKTQLAAARAELSTAEGDAIEHKDFDAAVEALAAKRREIGDLEYRASLLAEKQRKLHVSLSGYGLALITSGRDNAGKLSERVLGELHTRLAPFLTAKAVKSAIPFAAVVPLQEPTKLAESMKGHLAQLRTDPVETCAILLDKAERITAAAAKIDASLKPAKA